MFWTIVHVSLLGFVVGLTSPCPKNQVPFGSTTTRTITCVDADSVYSAGVGYLRENLPLFDALNAATLGLDQTNEPLGVATNGLNLSIAIKGSSGFSAQVPYEFFLEYVAPYANTNEGRSAWRTLFTPIVMNLLENANSSWRNFTTVDAVQTINNHLWDSAFGKKIIFKAGQTPLIYDVMSTLAFGHASCTGLSIFLVNALRSVGIASRVVGTPAWNNVVENGNHNWVEVWSPEEGWQFLQAQPAGPGERLDHPCDKWFCKPSYMANGTKVYAVRYTQKTTTRIIMAWDLDNPMIPGIDRTDYYLDICSKCRQQ